MIPMEKDVQALIMQNTRFKMLHELRGARTPTTLADRLQLNYDVVWYHLKMLVDAGLVEKLPRPRSLSDPSKWSKNSKKKTGLSQTQAYRLSKMGRGECEALGVFNS